LLLLALFFAAGFAVVVSSFAVMSPNGPKATIEPVDRAAQQSFITNASRDCAAVLPKYRPVFADSVDGPDILAAARQVALLGGRLAALPAGPDMQGPVQEWLQEWDNFTTEERRYAAIIGSATDVAGRVAPRALPVTAQLAANSVRREADLLAVDADRFSANLVGTSCRLEQAPTA
jgi:hypothetical protein